MFEPGFKFEFGLGFGFGFGFVIGTGVLGIEFPSGRECDRASSGSGDFETGLDGVVPISRGPDDGTCIVRSRSRSAETVDVDVDVVSEWVGSCQTHSLTIESTSRSAQSSKASRTRLSPFCVSSRSFVEVGS